MLRGLGSFSILMFLQNMSVLLLLFASIQLYSLFLGFMSSVYSKFVAGLGGSVMSIVSKENTVFH